MEPMEVLKYNRRKGTSGIGGQLYEIELLMLFLLEGTTKKEDRKIDAFTLATNMEEAGDFDDVVLRYKFTENGEEKSKVTFLQAKHKETTGSVKEKKIAIDTLLSQGERGDFLLRKYLSSYSKIKQQLGKSGHPIFGTALEHCEFIIYTNSKFDHNKGKGMVEKGYVEQGNILNLKDNSNEFYRLTEDMQVINALRHSLDYEVLVRELARSVAAGQIDKNKLIFQDYHISLAESVIERKNQGGALRESFLGGGQNKELRDSFFEEIQKEKEFAGKSINELKGQLRGKNIQLPNDFGNSEENDLKLLFPSKVFSEDEIRIFLNSLKLFVDQPNEENLGKILKEKIREKYNVAEQDVDSVFSDVKNKVLVWWKRGSDYLTENNRFFQDSLRISIRFDMKEPVALFTGRIKELEELHEILQDRGGAIISQMASVTGLGGIGKSELARKYVSEHSRDYDDNFIWINAESYQSKEDSFRILAQDRLNINIKNLDGKEKNIESIISEIYTFFTERNRKCLFIFDNAYNIDEGVEKFLPSGPNKPCVLITSRDEEWGNIKSLPLTVFTEKEAAEFIGKALKNVVKLNENDVKLLAEKLEFLPLALRHAVAYVKMENKKSTKWKTEKFTIDSYLELFGDKAHDILCKTPGEFGSYTETVLTTWKVTKERMKQKMCGEQALEILNVIAYLASDNIPTEEIFSILLSNKEERHIAVELLDQYSMANLEYGRLNIHRSVQQVTRIELERQGKNEEVMEKTFSLLRKCFTFSHNSDKPEDHTKKKELLPHLEIFLSHIDNWLSADPSKTHVIRKNYLKDLLAFMEEGYADCSNTIREKELLERRFENSRELLWN